MYLDGVAHNNDCYESIQPTDFRKSTDCNFADLERQQRTRMESVRSIQLLKK